MPPSDPFHGKQPGPAVFSVDHLTPEVYLLYCRGVPVGISDTVDGMEALATNRVAPKEPNPHKDPRWVLRRLDDTQGSD